MSPEEMDTLLRRLPVLEQLLTHLAREATATRQTLEKQHLDRERLIRVEQETYYEHLLESSRYREPKRLQRYERQVFSQHGEDGIIDEIFHRIGASGRTFIEIGVEDGKENNTAHLVQQGWQGVWVDADQQALMRAAQEFAKPIGESRLKILAAMVTAENIARILSENNAPREPDLMSLDIDRNTYYLWKALAGFKARLVVIEYNATMGPSQNWKVEYAANKLWNRTSYFGASLKAYEELGRELGYRLVGCETSGANAFFVREDLAADHFAEPYTSENHYEPPRYFLDRCAGHPRGFGDGA